MENKRKEPRKDIAIIGIGLKISCARDLEEYWEIIKNKIGCTEDFPKYRAKGVEGLVNIFNDSGEEPKFYQGSYIGRIDEFDNEFFQLSPREASLMDPAQRIFLETIRNTFDDAGYTAERLKQSKTGVFLGYTSSSLKDNYIVDIALNHPDLLPYSMTGNMAPLIPSRIAHLLDLKGPTMVMDTACSSALVALHEACEHILSGNCEMAVAGGLKLNVLPLILDNMKIGIEALDGKTRTFDSGADGSSMGEGCCTVLVKPLDLAEKDGDLIYAVIKSSSINHDGTASGLTAPNPTAQSDVMVDAWNKANINPEDIQYIEAHGTATGLGDPIEIQGINKAFCRFTDKKQFCAIGSSKSNLGHMYECSGLAALLKVVASMRHKTIPPTINFMSPNTNIDFINSPVYVNTEARSYIDNGKKYIAGVSAFGLSGTNCHVVLEAYNNCEEENRKTVDKPTLISIAAKSEYSLKAKIRQYLEYIRENYEEVDYYNFCYNVNLYNDIYDRRIAFVVTSKEDLLRKLKHIDNNGLIEYPDQEIYYHMIVRDNSDYKSRKAMLKQMDELTGKLNGLLEAETLERKDLEEVCEYFVLGATPQWEKMYGEYKGMHIHLPVYPFQPTSLWLPKKVYKNKKKLYYTKDFQMEHIMNVNNAPENILIIGWDESQIEDLKQGVLKKKSNGDTVLLKNVHALEQQKEEILEKMKKVSHIIYSLYECNTEDMDKLMIMQENNLHTLLWLAKLISNNENQENVKLVVLSKNGISITGDEEVINPQNTTALGLGKCISKELKKIKFCFVDYDYETTLDYIIQEINSKNKEEVVVYRNNIRYVERLKEIIPSGQDSSELLIDSGVYIVTGGLGGIGYETAKKICETTKDTTLIVIGRSELVTSGDIDPGQEKMLEKYNRYTTLAHLSKNIEYYKADISKYDRMEEILTTVRKKYGKINGVIHAAGIGGGRLIESTTVEDIDAMLKPKVYGTWNLDQLTKEDNLDFFVLYSSIATVFSSIELSAYTAANTYLDYFCQYRKANRCGKTYTINWATWSEIGMSVEHNFTVDTLFKTIKTKDGIKGFLDVLGSDYTNIIIGELNFDSPIALMMNNYPIKYSEYIMDQLAALKDKNKKKNVTDRPKMISGTGDSQYSDIEVKIAHACQEVLGYEEIDINDNFFEMGADSILMGHIFNIINEYYPERLQLTDLFAYPSVRQLSEYLDSKQDITSKRDKESKERVNNVPKHYGEKDVAIIGIGIDLPCAKNIDEYWEMIINGVSVVREIPEERAKDLRKHFRYLGMEKDNIRFNKCAYLDEINKFDYELFNMSPREAKLIDPINRLFLQCCNSAIEDAGYGGLKIRGSNTGVFLGYTANLGNLYSRILYELDAELFGESLPVNQVSMAASRIAYVNDLKGPTMVIDTACSSSLVAMHTACQQIRSGECDMALVGGASITMSPLAGGFTVGFESSEEKTRSFSEGAMGTAVGEGVGAILLKPLSKALEDKDSVYGVIKGSSSNQDGSSFGIAAPNYLAQSEVIQKAWLQSGIEPETISYIEAHGTGTALGDPIEVKGITHAFQAFTDKKQFCALGTIKPNIGHLNEASGISGIIKVLLMMKYRELPPTVFFQEPNQNIDFINSPVYMSALKREWKREDTPRRAGITGLGMSGTNCHIVLEEPPKIEYEEMIEDTPTVFVISAKYQEGLKILAQNLIQWLCSNEEKNLYDVLYTLATGRGHYNYRVGFRVNSINELISSLEAYLNGDDDNYRIHQGKYAIVSENKKVRQDFELTVEEHKVLNHKAEKLLEDVIHNRDKKSMEKLLEAYTKGADIDWLQLYNKEGYHLHLPTYPYKKEYCWFPPPSDPDEIESVNFDSFYYTMKWMREDYGESNLDGSQTGKTYLLFHSSYFAMHHMAELLTERGINVIQVFLGETYEKVDDSIYRINNSIESCVQLFEAINSYDIDKIIHLASISEENNKRENANIMDNTEYEQIEESLDNGFYHIINLIKAMINTHYSKNLELIILSQCAYSISKKEKVLYPENAVVLSIGKVIEQEYPNIECRAIDIQDAQDMPLAVDEILTKDRKLYLVGFREGIRYVECFTEETVMPQGDIIREDGNYIVTGGLGDIGIETAKYLSVKGCSSVTLLGRSGFLPREEWNSPDLSDEHKKKTAILREIEENGVRVLIYAVDISDYEGMKQVYQQIKEEVGRVHGIFHSAGIAGAGYILRKEKEEFAQVLAPKVRGTWIIDQLTKDEKLDFIMLYSSAVTFSGEAGQSDYVGANSYLDAFVDYRNARGDRTYVINWVSWKETGMSVRYGINVDTITKAITTSQAIYYLDRLLQSPVRKVIIGQYNINENLLVISDYSRNRISEDIQEKMDHLKKIYMNRHKGDRILTEDGFEVAQVKKGKLLILPHSEKTSHLDMIDELNIDNKVISNEIEDIQDNLCKIYSKILGYDDIDIYDNFFEMGGDSILLTRMHGYIDNLYSDIVNVANLFEYTSIYTLSEFIHDELMKKTVGKEEKEETGILSKYLDSQWTGELSYAQKRMYVVYKRSKNKKIYNNPFAFKLDKMESKENAYHCIKTLMDRHDVLRTSFYFNGKSICQRVEEDIEPDISYYYQEDINDIDYNELLTEFNLGKAPLFKVSVIELGNGGCVLFFDMHHIIIDGYSSSIINRELNDIITESPLAEATYQYKHYIEYEKDFVQSTEYNKMEGYWDERLKGYVRENYLQDFESQDKQDQSGSFSLTLDQELINSLEKVAKTNNASLFAMFLMGINLVIHMFDSSEDVIVGVPCIGRVHEDVMNIVGMFTNTLPMRNYPVADKLLSDFILEMKKNINNDLANQCYPYDRMVEKYRKTHKDGSSNLFNIMFDYESPNMDIVEGERKGSGDIILPVSFAKYDIDIQITNKNSFLVMKVDYSNEFSEEKVHDFIDKYLALLGHITKIKGEEKIGDIVTDVLEGKNIITA
ncbi:SDR family NAD(P)-dependent oxidoreductase [Vallitalea guaymasensis]|uniref:SDR family NAD(P)-dependent oxidoreductase n=1 Tax=Vallitalea guaymasensis TaxID=1185412 RepID=A0A8J8M903_9FIRM|nr:SDR family NAD(P)-dependent oxidoreductase [Vallitalea guaymasensis]QUH28423.1 SDR family NAD(P)-dependent oxidoreductase [Vallitalea guaymasensis]